MRYLLYGYYGYGNFGDDLLLRAVIEGIRSRQSKASFVVHNLNPVPGFQGDAAVRFTGLARLLQGIRRKPWRMLAYLAGFLREIGRSDVLAIGGGTLFIDKGRINVSIVLLLFAVWYARIAGKRVIVLGVAVDRLDNVVSLWATRRIFAAAEFIALRDELSLPYVDHVPRDRVRLSADLVFGLDVGVPDISFARPRPVIGLCFIDYYRTVELSGSRHRAYVDAILRLVERNLDRYDVACIAFQSGIGQRDDWLFEPLCGRFPGCRTMRIDSPESATELAKAVDVFVTTRFHLGVLGIMWRKPVVVVDHELKMRALAEEFGVPAVTLSDLVSGASLDIPDLVRSYAQDRVAERCRAARERAARNFDWLDGSTVLPSRSG